MPFPSFNNLTTFAVDQAREIQQFVGYLFGWLSAEHYDDGTHKAITADSIALDDNKTAGNVTGNLVPTTTTATLGTIDTAGLHTIRRWAKTYTDEIAFGSSALPLTGVAASVWRLFLSGTNLLWRAGITAGQSITFQDSSLNTLLQVGGSYLARSGVTGTDGVVVPSAQITNLYAVNGVYERTYSVPMGEWKTPTFAAGNYTSSTGTWTVAAGNVTVLRYMLIGKTMWVTFEINATSVSGGQAQLRITIPNGMTAAQDVTVGGLLYNDNGAGWVSSGNLFVASGITSIFMQPGAFGVGTWAASVGNTAVRGQLAFEVQ